jgi:hypothetical protein
MAIKCCSLRLFRQHRVKRKKRKSKNDEDALFVVNVEIKD